MSLCVKSISETEFLGKLVGKASAVLSRRITRKSKEDKEAITVTVTIQHTLRDYELDSDGVHARARALEAVCGGSVSGCICSSSLSCF